MFIAVNTASYEYSLAVILSSYYEENRVFSPTQIQPSEGQLNLELYFDLLECEVSFAQLSLMTQEVCGQTQSIQILMGPFINLNLFNLIFSSASLLIRVV